MFGWRKRKTMLSVAGTRPTASEVDAEYAEYRARIQKTMVFGGVLGTVSVGLFTLLAWMSEVRGAAQQAGNGSPASPTIVLAPLPSSMTVTGFSLLAAVAIALQLAVRTPSEVETRPATVLARRRFLCGIAQLVVLGAFALAIHASIPALADAPAVLDVVRLFGPPALALLIAFIAADAGVASDPDSAPAELGRVWRARVARRSLIGLRMIGHRISGTSKRAIGWQIVTLFAAPALIAGASAVAAPSAKPSQWHALVLVSLVIAVAIYGLTVSVYANAVAHEWVNVAVIVVIAATCGMVTWLNLAILMLQRAVDEKSTALAPALAVEAWALVYVAVPAALAVFLISPSRAGRPRVLGLCVRAILLRRLNSRHRGLNPKTAPQVNRLALTAPWVSFFVPFGMIIGVIAKHQIRHANSSPASPPQRGEWLANLAIIMTIAVLAVLIVALFVGAAADPAEWRRIVWG